MKSELKQIGEHIITNPKTGYFAVFITTVENWWIDWGSPLMSLTTSLASLVLLFVLISFHLKRIKKLNLDIDEQIKNAESN